jgi:hypothetical protein
MYSIPSESQGVIVRLFKAGHTVNEIASETRIDKDKILLFLTRIGYWSQYCSDCTVKRCYDCRGLQELGKPLSVQDKIDLMADLKRKAQQ